MSSGKFRVSRSIVVLLDTDPVALSTGDPMLAVRTLFLRICQFSLRADDYSGFTWIEKTDIWWNPTAGLVAVFCTFGVVHETC